MTKRIAILGSTGSIGTQALDVVREQPEHFQVELLSCGNNVDLLIKQALEFTPNAVVIGDPAKLEQVKEVLFPAGIKAYAGAEALEQAHAVLDVTRCQAPDVVNRTAERVLCLFVLNSVTSTPMWIRQLEPREMHFLCLIVCNLFFPHKS